MDFQLIRPKALVIDYNFTENECYRELTGVCSLDFFDPIEKKTVISRRTRNNYCRDIYQHLKNNEDFNLIDPIELIKFSCNHYEIQCGRHRICICEKMNLAIKAIISIEDGKCCKCLKVI